MSISTTFNLRLSKTKQLTKIKFSVQKKRNHEETSFDFCISSVGGGFIVGMF